jgi:hypothetical protein
MRAFTTIGWPGVNGMRAVPADAPPAAGAWVAGSDTEGWLGVLFITAPPRNWGGTLLMPWE